MTSNRDTIALELAELVRGSGIWRRTHCKFCELWHGLSWDHRSNWCLNTSTGYYHCFRCQTRGYLPGYSPPEAEEEENLGPLEGIEPPEGFISLAEDDRRLTQARTYVLSRGITKKTALRAGLGACIRGPFAGRIVVPVFDADDRTWVGWSARLYVQPKHERVPKYRYPEGMPRARIVYNMAALNEDTTRPLLVVEGVFDALPHYPDAVALLGKPSPAQLDLLCETERPLIIALDGDSWNEGYWLAKQLSFRADVKACSLRLPPREDPCSVAPWVRSEIDRRFGPKVH